MFVFTAFICFLLFSIILGETDVLIIDLRERSQCDPNKIYKDDNKTCICTDSGTWANQECLSSFGSETTNDNCDPNKYIFVDCNVCLCGPDGKINKNRCSQHNCGNLNKTRRSESVVGNCDPKTIYELAPCQFCYCINKLKLVCNNKPRTEKIKLGNYELIKCSDNLIKELSDLIPEKHQKSKKKAYKGKKRSGKKIKKMTTAIHLIDSNQNSLEELVDSRNKYSYRNTKKYSDTEYTNSNKRDHQSFEGTFYGKDYSEMPKAITSDALNDFSIEIDEKKKTYNKMSTLSDLDPLAYVSDLIDGKNLSHPITISIPTVLDKVLSLVLRKSMVSLDPGNNCTPGSKRQDKCNACFCLSNGKMLCTKNTCK